MFAKACLLSTKNRFLVLCFAPEITEFLQKVKTFPQNLSKSKAKLPDLPNVHCDILTVDSEWLIDLETLNCELADHKPIDGAQLDEFRVPASALSRAVLLGRAALSVATSSGLERLKRPFGGGRGNSDAGLASIQQSRDALTLSQTLRKMRGAALKLGQALSIQEDSLIPVHIREAFDSSRDSAFKMPRDQLQRLLNAELGADWSATIFSEFDFEPFAAASIGQVHKARARAKTVSSKLSVDRLILTNDQDYKSESGVLQPCFLNNARIKLHEKIN